MTLRNTLMAFKNPKMIDYVLHLYHNRREVLYLGGGGLDINELVGDLVEAIQHKTLEESYQVQRGSTDKNRGCDITSEPEPFKNFALRELGCKPVEGGEVNETDMNMNEKVAEVKAMNSEVEYRSMEPRVGQETENIYKDVVDDRKSIQNCYNISRKTQVREQNCHFELKEFYEAEMRTRYKKAKKYNYIKDCREQLRQICDQGEMKSIQPLYNSQERLDCKEQLRQICDQGEMKSI